MTYEDLSSGQIYTDIDLVIKFIGSIFAQV